MTACRALPALLDLKAPYLLVNEPSILQTVPSSAPDLDLPEYNFGHPTIYF